MRRLIIRPGAIGDCVLALPAMEFLATEDTEVWTPTAVMPLIRFARRVRSIAASGLDLVGLADVEPPRKLVEELRGFDSIVSWYGAKREEFQRALKDLCVRAEFYPALPDATDLRHCADFFAEQVGAPVPAMPHIDVGEIERGDYAVLHPFSGSARKNWPLARYRELAARLEMPVYWCAGPEDAFEGAKRIEDLYELARWVAGARVYVGNDSGITHLAAAAGANVVAIFGPTDPARWGPRGKRVRIVAGKLDEISVDRVLAECCF